MTVQKGTRDKQKGLMQMGGVFVFITVIALFFILDLGDKEEPQRVADVAEEGLNTNLPDPNDVYRSGGKMEAVRKEHARLDGEMSQRKAQNASFDMLASLCAPPRDDVQEISKIDVDGLLAKIENETTENETGEFVKEEAPVVRTSSRGRSCKTTIKEKSPEELMTDSLEREMERIKISSAKRRVQCGLGTREDTLLLGLAHSPQKVEASVAQVAAPIVSNRPTRGFAQVGAGGPVKRGSDISAVIHGEHRNVKTSSQVMLHLEESIYIDGEEIPAATILYGTTTFGDSRIDLKINNIKYKNKIYPFRGTVYDNDGERGLYTGCNLLNEAARDVASSSSRNKSGSAFTVVPDLISRIADRMENVKQKAIRVDHVDLHANHRVTIKME